VGDILRIVQALKVIPPDPPTWQVGTSFQSHDDIKAALKSYQGDTGYRFVTFSSDIPGGRYKFICERGQNRKEKSIKTSKKTKCTAFIAVYKLRVMAVQLDHNHEPLKVEDLKYAKSYGEI